MSSELNTDSRKKPKIRKNARLKALVTQEQKELIEKAAFLRGQNLTEFRVSVLAEAATETLKDRALLELTERDRLAFAEALLNPPVASKQAQADSQWYQQIMSKQFFPH